MSKSLEQLLKQIAIKDSQSFQQLYDASLSSLRSVAKSIVRCEEQVKDVLQDAYLLLWNNAAAFDEEKGNALTWMKAIVRYRALEQIKKSGRIASREQTMEVEFQDDSKISNPENQFYRQQVVSTLSETLNKLDDASSTSLLMAYVHGYSGEEISAHLQMPLNTVKSKVRRGLQTLNKNLDSDLI